MKVKLGEICTVSSAKRVFEKEYVKSGIPFIRGLEITNGSLLDENALFECYISKERYDELKRIYGVPQKGDILITAVGTIGNLCYIDREREFYFKDGNVIWIKNISKNVCPKYLYYFMQGPYFKNQLEYALIGAVQKALTMVMLEKMEIELPDYEMQVSVAAILDCINSKIGNNNKVNSELEAMAKTIYDYWFLQFEFPNEEGKPYKSSGGEMVWNEELKEEIPVRWEVKGVEAFGTLSNGINYSKGEVGDKTYKIVNVRNISNTSLFLDKANMDEIILRSKISDQYLLKKDDILIARSGIPGAIRILEDDIENTIYCGFIICLSLESPLYRKYLVYRLKDYENTTATTSGGTIMQNVNQSTLKNIKFPVPEDECISAFNEKIDSIWMVMKNKFKENQELIAVRNFLLPLLMNGQVGFKD